MPKSEKIRVMISSRCEATIHYQGKPTKLSEVRLLLQKSIKTSLFAKPGDDASNLEAWPGLEEDKFFDCWINEDSAGSSWNETWWKRCQRESRLADVVIVVYNGESGGSIKKEPMGICHAELEAALATESRKVRGVRLLPLAPLPKDPLQRVCDEKFRAYADSLDIFVQKATTGEELIRAVHKELRQALLELVQSAAVTPDLATHNTGLGLAWHRMSYLQRRNAMRAEIASTLTNRGSTPEKLKPKEEEWMTFWVTIAGKKLLVCVHAVPAAFSQSAAREKVGQPFLMDHTLHDTLAGGDGGPLHIVACYKGATESQALKMLGFPDATVVPGEFGMHVADSVQKIQMVMLKNCQSPTSTQRALTSWLEWLQRSDEDDEVVKRAAARKSIIAAIASVNSS